MTPAHAANGPAGFAADFVAALVSDFAEHGADAISALRRRDPNAYLRICASVLPRDAAASDPLEGLTDEQLAARMERLPTVSLMREYIRATQTEATGLGRIEQRLRVCRRQGPQPHRCATHPVRRCITPPPP